MELTPEQPKETHARLLLASKATKTRFTLVAIGFKDVCNHKNSLKIFSGGMCLQQWHFAFENICCSSVSLFQRPSSLKSSSLLYCLQLYFSFSAGKGLFKCLLSSAMISLSTCLYNMYFSKPSHSGYNICLF